MRYARRSCTIAIARAALLAVDGLAPALVGQHLHRDFESCEPSGSRDSISLQETVTRPLSHKVEVVGGRRRPLADTLWMRPELVAEIGFAEWTAEGRLRQPRFLGLRNDKRPAEVVREQPVKAPTGPCQAG